MAKLDPTKPTASRARSGKSLRKPAIEAIVRRARGSLPAALLRRFIDVDLLAQSAALALYAILSLAPLLLILVWLTSAIMPGAQEALMQQIAQLGGAEAEHVARTIVANAEANPDTGSIAGWWSLGLLFVAATTVFAQLQDVLNKIFRTDATALTGFRALGGGAATAVLFLLGRAAIAWYLGQSNPASASAYGSMGTIVLALVWIYYAALVVFVGALLTAVVDERAKEKSA